MSTLRLELTLPEKVADQMKRVAGLVGAEGLVEVIRRALSVYDTLVTSHAEGCTILVRRPDGHEEPLDLLGTSDEPAPSSRTKRDLGEPTRSAR